MQKKYVLATSAAVIVFVAGALTYNVYAQKNNSIAAVVNGEQITVAEIREAYDQNARIKAQVPFEEFYDQALEYVVNNKLVLQAATKDNVQASPEYQRMLADLQDDVARQVYIEKKVEEKITPAEVDKIYGEYVANFKPQKEIKAQHILVDDENLAKEIIAKLNKKPADFEALAKKHSKDSSDLGYFTAEMMVPEFSEAAFAMEKGAISKEPVKTEFGYHIIKVEEIRETKPLPLETIVEQIKGGLAQKALAEVIKDLNSNAQIEKYDLTGKKM